MAINIYTMGETGHGKTTLTAAIMYCLDVAYPTLQEGGPAGADTSGVSRETYSTPAHQYTHADCPVSQRDAMLAASPKMDVGIVVISASDGPMPGTRDSLASARNAGVSNLVVFLNKSDLVPDVDLLELIEMEVRELVSSQKFPGDSVPVVVGSAMDALGSSGTREDPKAATVFALVDAIDKSVPAGSN
jgi:elongation factor Tu